MLAAVIPGDSNTVLEVLRHAAGDLAVRCGQRYSESLQVQFTDSGAPVASAYREYLRACPAIPRYPCRVEWLDDSSRQCSEAPERRRVAASES